jgi:hypothetical protein
MWPSFSMTHLELFTLHGRNVATFNLTFELNPIAKFHCDLPRIFSTPTCTAQKIQNKLAHAIYINTYVCANSRLRSVKNKRK